MGWVVCWVGLGGFVLNEFDCDKVCGVCYFDVEGEVRGVLSFVFSEWGDFFWFFLYVCLFVGEMLEVVVVLWCFVV